MRTILFVLLLPTLCLASDWKPLPGFPDVTYDADTTERKTNGVHLWVKNPNYAGGSIKGMFIYCNDRYITYEGAAGIIREQALPDTRAEKTVEALCKRAWEIWK